MNDVLLHVIPSIIIAITVQIVMHEVGHFIGGILTGWKFLYLQVFHFAIVKENNRLSIKWISAKNYQCIMYPKGISCDAIIYSLGGILMNAIITVISAVVLIMNQKNILVWEYTLIFIVFGCAFLYVNGVPSTKRICNDMSCCLLLKEDEHTRVCHNSQLMIASELMGGKTYGEISTELLCLSQEAADNDILAYHTVLEYYHYLDIEDYKGINEVLPKIKLSSKVSQGVRDIILMEELYHDIITRLGNQTKTMPDVNRYDGDIEIFINKYSVAGDVHTIRIKAAFNALRGRIKNDNTSIELCYDAMKTIIKTKALYEGEKLFCNKQISMIIRSL